MNAEGHHVEMALAQEHSRCHFSLLRVKDHAIYFGLSHLLW
jgi:hypothetical protein